MIPVFSVFSGIGGLDLGARIAGLSIVTAVDADQRALDIHSAVIRSETVCGLVQNLDVATVVRNSGIPRDGSSIVIGGPPCTAFSHAGFWIERKRNGEDAQANRVADFLQFIRYVRPRAFVMENVPGLLFRNHVAVLDRFEDDCARLSYNITRTVLNAADFGVPQKRRRLFVVGIKGAPLHLQVGTFARSHRTAGWALAGLRQSQNAQEVDEQLRGKYSHLLPLVPPGGNYLHFTSERGCARPLFGWRQKYWSFLLKLDPNAASPTIPATRITNNGPFHWLDRHLRIAELKRLQTLPDEMRIPADVTGRRHIGNAVPPLLAANVLWQLRRALGDTRRLPEAIRIASDPGASPSAVSAALMAGAER